MLQHGSHKILEGPIRALGHTVLVRCVGYGKLLMDTVGLQVFAELGRDVLTPPSDRRDLISRPVFRSTETWNFLNAANQSDFARRGYTVAQGDLLSTNET